MAAVVIVEAQEQARFGRSLLCRRRGHQSHQDSRSVSAGEQTHSPSDLSTPSAESAPIGSPPSGANTRAGTGRVLR